jgi:class 3 adenylate cyclase
VAVAVLTVLVTDIVDSARLWSEYETAMAADLVVHDDIVAGVIVSHGGRVFKHTGDGALAVFDDPVDAVAAASELQRRVSAQCWAVEDSLRIRVALHSGVVHERDGDVFGSPVNRASRLADVCPPGAVVLSDATVSLLRDRTVVGMVVVAVGEVRLRGLQEPSRVYGLQAPHLEPVVVAVAGESRRGNLPVPAGEFVGQHAELAALARELEGRRLVTLTGPGGVGKTRLAIETAWAAVDRFEQGVWFVDLAPVIDPDTVIVTVAAVFGVQAQGQRLLDAIVDWMRERRVLIVFDNAEHVLGPVAELVGAITASVPTARVVVTSREPLGITGEQVWPVRSLDPVVEAPDLFVARAVAADRTVVFDDADRAVIETICRRLDGIPLAIELAAARSRTFTPNDLLARLDDRFRLLRGAGRGGLERHATLRAAVSWSYQLLDEREQRLFDRLSVFAGGFDLDAAEHVCGVDDVGDVADVL